MPINHRNSKQVHHHHFVSGCKRTKRPRTLSLWGSTRVKFISRRSKAKWYLHVWICIICRRGGSSLRIPVVVLRVTQIPLIVPYQQLQRKPPREWIHHGDAASLHEEASSIHHFPVTYLSLFIVPAREMSISCLSHGFASQLTGGSHYAYSYDHGRIQFTGTILSISVVDCTRAQSRAISSPGSAVRDGLCCKPMIQSLAPSLVKSYEKLKDDGFCVIC